MNHFTLIKQYITQISMSCWYCAWFKSLITVLITFVTFLFGAANFDIIFAIVALMTFDLITGVIAAKIRGERIESRRIWKTAVKMAAYGILMSASYLTGKIIPGGDMIFVATSVWLALTELISIMENVGKMGYSVPQKLLNQLQEMRKEK